MPWHAIGERLGLIMLGVRSFSTGEIKLTAADSAAPDIDFNM